MISSGSIFQCMRSTTIGSPFPHRSDSQGDLEHRGPRGQPEHPHSGSERDVMEDLLSISLAAVGSWPFPNFPLSVRETAAQSV